MGFTELLLISLGLSMDAFAVAVCKGLKTRKITAGKAALIALFFGGFQAIMPLIGWFLGSRFEEYITDFDHWIAFALLLIIGGNMIFEAVKGNEEEMSSDLKIKELFALAIATSIDALAVGITFAFLKANILFSVITIGITTFILSLVGVFVGHKFGAKYKNKAEIAGGVILIAIGLKILLEHLGIISF